MRPGSIRGGQRRLRGLADRKGGGIRRGTPSDAGGGNLPRRGQDPGARLSREKPKGVAILPGDSASRWSQPFAAARGVVPLHPITEIRKIPPIRRKGVRVDRRPPERGPRIIDRPGPGQIRLIDDDGKQLGIVSIVEALRIAEEKELDLVEIAPNADPPTCRLLDYGKFKYQQTKNLRQSKKPVQRRKEVKLRPKTEEHDFQVKVQRARRFLEKGHKVLVTMMFRGREAVHMDIGKDLLMRFAREVEDIAKVEKEPLREGNRLNMILVHK